MINPSEVNLSDLPSIPLKERRLFPCQPAIYFAIDSLNQVQYIGKSANPRARWTSHHRLKEIKAIGSIKVAFLFVGAEFLAEMEYALISQFKPLLNVIDIANNPKCPDCGRMLVANGTTSNAYQRWNCREDRGGCGHSHLDSDNTHGGSRTPKIYKSNAEKQKAYRDRKKAGAKKLSVETS